MQKQFKYAVNTNSLKDVSCQDVVKLCLKVGADGVEWGLPSLEKAAAAAAEMYRVTTDAGLEICSYINGGHLWKTDLIRRWSDAIKPAGGKVLRVAPPWYAYNFEESLHQKDSYLDLVKRTRDGLEKLVPIGKEYGIKYVVEIHAAGISASVPLVRQMMDGLDSSCVGIIYDPANALIEGGILPRGAVEVMGPYLAYVHAKNIAFSYAGQQLPGKVRRAEWNLKTCSLEYGALDWLLVFFALKLVDYHGWISFEEFFRDPLSAETELAGAVRFAKLCAEHAPAQPEEPFTTFND
ncbi:MAG: sugar phosphate isomerase/epimerase [Candidatus Omnitrophica bacterium]|nr:sugar phosphate isomerase/epimerase [Candidatus Omnitrophota bacterium]